MGLFGGSKSEKPEANQVVARKYGIGGEALGLKSKLEYTMKALMLSLGKTDDKMQLASSLVLIQQNEVIIKYLDDILKKLETEESAEA